ncbi:peptidase S41-like protein [Taibaiella chishuiensis]|uniref:Peptidase S41-like protein n=2 Tax=Taibaiella chishuiensis TaxID=1434707 RepID=A0A2P8CY24_9BACT|nr:peptidase S41-like protein [Taibaiella chishuiensis]
MKPCCFHYRDKRLLFMLLMVFLCFSAADATALGSEEPDIRMTGKENKVARLANFCRVWGFLKYYHPAIAGGQYDWDREMLDMLPGIWNADSDPAAYKLIETWVGAIEPGITAAGALIPISRKVKLQADFSTLFNEDNLPLSLRTRLTRIRDSYKPALQHKYIAYTPQVGNPVFNENAYDESPYPNTGLRLLALYRYWNMIQYFYPYRYLNGKEWDRVLDEFIPRFINAANKEDYTLTSLELISRIHDSHAGIAKNSVLDSLKGNWILPYKTALIEDKLVITGYYGLPDTVSKPVAMTGDIIEAIDGIPVDTLIRRYLPFTPGSNYETRLRDMAGLNGFLPRAARREAELRIRNEKGVAEVSLQRISLLEANQLKDKTQQGAAYKMLPGNIGYIYPGSLAAGDFVKIRDSFAHTRGLIIDFRCYPATFMPFTYGQWLKGGTSAFAYFTQPDLQQPGNILYSDTVFNGMHNPDYYPGKVIIIVNARTQSQAEYSTMALSTAYRVKVLGSTTAGADGNVSRIVLPGGIQTMISGLGVYYPDGSETQRTGIKIDIPVRPTIAGVRKGKDELLDKAISLMQEGH